MFILYLGVPLVSNLTKFGAKQDIEKKKKKKSRIMKKWMVLLSDTSTTNPIPQF